MKLLGPARSWASSVVVSQSMIGICFLVGLGLSVLRTMELGMPPAPRVHDEFSYLLGADTFRSGRLTNPPHALADHFDTFHIIQAPTYSSKYPPAQALAIAIGWRLSGHPIVGVWLGFATMSAAFYWMLLVWLGPRWAFAATMAATSWLSLSYWATSYWGGAVPACGGALVYGAIPRIRDKPRAAPTVVFGIGLAVLANSRPFEGLLAAIPALFSIASITFNKKFAIRDRVVRVVVPLVLLGGMTIGAMAAYNRAVTGSALRMPHLVYEHQKEAAPLFLWQKARPIRFSNSQELAFQKWALRTYASETGLVRGARAAVDKLGEALDFAIPPGLMYPLLLIPILLFRRVPLATTASSGVALALVGLSVATWFEPHYIAPIFAPFLAVYFSALRLLPSVAPRFTSLGLRIVVVTITMWIVPPAIYLVARMPGLPWYQPTVDWATARVHLADSLGATGGHHVLLVRYPSDYTPHHEWVFNGANIDKQSVIWARDLGAARNRQLLDYYSDRKIWSVEILADAPYYRLLAYPSRDTLTRETSFSPRQYERRRVHEGHCARVH